MIRFFLCYFLSKDTRCTGKCNKLVKKKKEIKLVRESNANYTFLDTGLIEVKPETGNDTSNKTDSTIDKDLVKMRSIDSKKSMFRYKGRLIGGQNQQGHSSVYE